MRPLLVRLTVAALAAAPFAASSFAAAPAAAQQAGADTGGFTWQGAVPVGQWIRVHNVMGGVSVRGGSGDRVEVRGVKHGRRVDAGDVRFQVTRLAGGSMLICVLWSETAHCDERGYHDAGDGNRQRDIDVSVDITVLLPRGVKVDGSTVNGRVDITGATSDVEAHTVNGSVDAASMGGDVEAGTVNGELRVRMDRAPSRNLSFSTVNGSVRLSLPPALNADIEMTTVNGRFRSDYPVTVQGTLDPRHLRATLGTGGPRIRLTTVNGSLELRKIS